MNPTHPVSAIDALRRLREGNQRFAANLRAVSSLAAQAHRAELARGQSPFAIVLSCSDSRVPSELVFDCGLGDLFVVRVAGNILAPSLLGSIEFAASTFGTQLVVVMGHSHCGAVTATLKSLTDAAEASSENIADIVSRISPSIQALTQRRDLGGEALLQAAVRANVQATVRQIRTGSQIVAERMRRGALDVVGAEYDIATGVVDFFDGAASGDPLQAP